MIFLWNIKSLGIGEEYTNIASANTATGFVTNKMPTTVDTTIVTTHDGTNFGTTDLRTKIHTPVMDKTNMNESGQKETAIMETAKQCAAILLAIEIVNYAELLVKSRRIGKG